MLKVDSLISILSHFLSLKFCNSYGWNKKTCKEEKDRTYSSR